MATRDTSERRALLYQLLLDSTLIAASQPNEGSRTWTANPGDALVLRVVEDEDGTVLPLFTDLDALSIWSPDGGGYLVMPAAELVRMAARNGTMKIGLNPGSDTWGWVTRPEIEALARGRMPFGPTSQIFASPTTLEFGIPRNPPSASSVAVVCSALASEAVVDRASYCPRRRYSLGRFGRLRH